MSLLCFVAADGWPGLITIRFFLRLFSAGHDSYPNLLRISFFSSTSAVDGFDFGKDEPMHVFMRPPVLCCHIIVMQAISNRCVLVSGCYR